MTSDGAGPSPRFPRPGVHGGTRATLESLGLGADGDEWAAIVRIERAFGVRLDERDAPGWRTVGDVLASLLRVLPEAYSNPDETWARLASAIAAETGADPQRVAPGTLLFAVPLWNLVGRWLRGLTRR